MSPSSSTALMKPPCPGWSSTATSESEVKGRVTTTSTNGSARCAPDSPIEASTAPGMAASASQRGCGDGDACRSEGAVEVSDCAPCTAGSLFILSASSTTALLISSTDAKAPCKSSFVTACSRKASRSFNFSSVSLVALATSARTPSNSSLVAAPEALPSRRRRDSSRLRWARAATRSSSISLPASASFDFTCSTSAGKPASCSSCDRAVAKPTAK
mmetsp:Transcript_73378/g.212559  ORF Transcript_73378/g.212559 Transcript_73378/m.212559 type:complete len:216 (+) Transcript_73378:2254-2901(+)